MSVRIEASEFQHIAEALQVGRSIRAAHCGDKKTMIVTREAGRLHAHCFRCDGSGEVRQQESLEDKLRRMAQERNADARARVSLELPEPRVYTLSEWPRDAALWLYKAGFSPSMIDKLGAYWCPLLGRVVLPVMEDDRAVFWQARSIKRQPKILSPEMPRRGVVGRYGRGDTLVLCEDTLSAYKVGQVTEAWSLLGTKLLPAPAAEIIASGRPVVTWLDNDEAGKRGAAQIQRALRAYGISVRNVVTPKDPKQYSRAYIEEKINGKQEA